MRKWLLLLLCVCCVFGTLTMVGCSKPAEEPGVGETSREGEEHEGAGPPPDEQEEPKPAEE